MKVKHRTFYFKEEVLRFLVEVIVKADKPVFEQQCCAEYQVHV